MVIPIWVGEKVAKCPGRNQWECRQCVRQKGLNRGVDRWNTVSTNRKREQDLMQRQVNVRFRQTFSIGTHFADYPDEFVKLSATLDRD